MEIIKDNIVPIIFVTGLILVNLSVYLFDVPAGIFASGFSFILIALMIDNDMKSTQSN